MTDTYTNTNAEVKTGPLLGLASAVSLLQFIMLTREADLRRTGGATDFVDRCRLLVRAISDECPGMDTVEKRRAWIGGWEQRVMKWSRWYTGMPYADFLEGLIADLQDRDNRGMLMDMETGLVRRLTEQVGAVSHQLPFDME